MSCGNCSSSGKKQCNCGTGNKGKAIKSFTGSTKYDGTNFVCEQKPHLNLYQCDSLNVFIAGVQQELCGSSLSTVEVLEQDLTNPAAVLTQTFNLEMTEGLWIPEYQGSVYPKNGSSKWLDYWLVYNTDVSVTAYDAGTDVIIPGSFRRYHKSDPGLIAEPNAVSNPIETKGAILQVPAGETWILKLVFNSIESGFYSTYSDQLLIANKT